MQLISELVSVTHFDQADATMEFHLVSWSETVDENEVERFGIFVQTEDGNGSLIASFAPDVPLEVAVSTWIAFGWSQMLSGTERASEIVRDFMEPPATSSLIIPDTASVEAITR